MTNANAAIDALGTCVDKISADTTWQSKASEIFGGVAELDDAIVEQNKAKIYTLLSDRFTALCGEELVLIAKTSGSRAEVAFNHNNKKYAFDFDVDKIFNNVGMQMGIMVINRRDLYPTKVLKLSEIPKKQKFFSDACSDHIIWDNLDDDAAINVAGQAVFSEYGGTEHEFFLDFAEGDNKRAFPGLVIQDITGSNEERIVAYTNIKTAVERTKQFADKLQKSQCSQQNLSVYLVALNVQELSRSHTNEIAAGSVSGAGLATGGIAAGIAAHGAAAGGTAAAGIGAAGITAIAGFAVGVVAAGAAAYFILKPNDIANIQQVMVLDGPYDL